MSEGLPDFQQPGTGKDLTIARFYLRPVHNKSKSDAAGRPIYDEIEYVEIIIPGNRGTTVDERAKPEHRERWPAAYEAYRRGVELAQEGTPLEEWAGIGRGQIEELKYFNVRNVEALAGLSDSDLQKCAPMGGHALRDKAKRFLEAAAGAAVSDKLAAENLAQRETIAILNEKITDLSRSVERLLSDRGRAEGGAQ